MRLTMKERRSVSKVISNRYKKAPKKEKSTILDEFIQLTGYNRAYACWLLSSHSKKLPQKASTLASLHTKSPKPRPKTYDEQVLSALIKVWFIMDQICGKRLAPMMEEVVTRLEAFGELKLLPSTREKLLSISASTIDRLLASERKKLSFSSKSKTKPGTLLKNQIPIRTFSDWDEQLPGFVELDLVAHDGGLASGDYLQTLDVTDVFTGWTETQGVRNKAQVWVFEAIKLIRARFPFEMLGIDSDNGSEFINHELLRYCQEQKITFTRSRSYRKNDNCYVEQKNYSVVRRSVGYLRYDTEEELLLINELYGYLRLYTNYFQPSMKLIEKSREGSKVKKRYDHPQTPYRRVLGSEQVSNQLKQRLRKQYAKLNPAELKRKITELQNRLIDLAAMKQAARQSQGRLAASRKG
jgi:hypothetical protein